MKPQALHIHIARLVVDGAIDEVAAVTHDPARLAMTIGTYLRDGSPSATQGKMWQRSVADAVASRLQAAGVSILPTEVPHGYD